MTGNTSKFSGFPPGPSENFWQYPKALDQWWSEITPSEHVVLTYILRHTWGYQKNADAISLNQFRQGIKRRDGRQVDCGIGIKDVKTIRKALSGLVNKGFIETTPVIGGPTVFRLRLNLDQDMVEVPKNGTPPCPKNGISTPYQNTVSTIENYSIKNTNTATKLVQHLSQKLGGVKFPFLNKQYIAVDEILAAGYTEDDIKWAIDQMICDPWWKEKSFNMVNVAHQIPKLMTREVRFNAKN